MSLLLDAMSALADQSANALLIWSWQALLLLACVWLGLKLFRVQTPALRHHIWLLALLAVVILPLWPSLPVSQRHYEALSFATELPRMVIAPTVELQPPTLQLKPTRVVAQPATNFPWLVGVFCLWAAGMLVTCVRNMQSFARLKRIRRLAKSVSFAELGCGPAFNQNVALGLSEEIHSPILHGIRHPMILLPHDLTEWTTAAEREAMLSHELAHLMRRDHFTNSLPVVLNTIFFFHPLVRYACRQFCLERELACDDHVIHYGADAATYAESLLKAAERSLCQTTAFGLHQPAFFTAKQTLERRVEMILTHDRVRILSRHWRYLVLPALLLVALLIALSSSNIAGKSATSFEPSSFEQDDLVERAIANPDAAIRLATVQRLAEINGQRGTISLLEVYQRSSDERVKEAVIRCLAKREEDHPLAAIAQAERTPELQQLAKKSWNTVLARRQQNKLDQLAASGVMPPPPPPPPPPVRATLPNTSYEFHLVGNEVHSLLKPLGHTNTQIDGKRGSKLKLPRFNLSAAFPNFVLSEGAYYFLDRFEIELDGNGKLYGRGVLRVTPKTSIIEYALSTDGGIYLDPECTQKVELSEFLK